MARRGTPSLDSLTERVAALERVIAGLRSRLEALEPPPATLVEEPPQPPVASPQAPHEPIADQARDKAHEPDTKHEPGEHEPEDGGTW